MLVHRHMDHLALGGPKYTQGTDIAGRLAQHHVARIAEDPGHQVQTLLRADGHRHIVRVGCDSFQPHHFTDGLAHGGLPRPALYCMACRPLLITSSCRMDPPRPAAGR